MAATGGVGENNLQLVHVRGCGKLWRYCCWKVKVKNPKTLYEDKVTSGMQVEALFVSEIFHFPLELGLRSSLMSGFRERKRIFCLANENQ